MATRVAFFIAGFTVAAWAPLVPYVKIQARLGDAMLGLLLLSLGLGSMVAMPLAGWLAGRFGCRVTILVAAAIIAAVLPTLAMFPTLAWLSIALPVFGFALGALDVTMNIQAVIVERDSGRAMMSGLHAHYSMGGIAGAGGMGLLLWLGVPPVLATACGTLLVALLLLASGRHNLPFGGSGGGPAFARPRGMLLIIGLACFVVFLSEGAVLDWGGVFLTSMRGVDVTSAGFAYAAFAIAMTVGRLCGDRIVQALGGGILILAGGIAAAIGCVGVVVMPVWPLQLVGFAMIGLGCSNIVPVFFTAAGRQRIMPEAQAIAAITTLGYAGVLTGPAAIGFIAQMTSLTVAFVIIALLLLCVSAAAPLIENVGRYRAASVPTSSCR